MVISNLIINFSNLIFILSAYHKSIGTKKQARRENAISQTAVITIESDSGSAEETNGTSDSDLE